MKLRVSQFNRSSRNNAHTSGDFTLQDFANTSPSARKTARLKKGAIQTYAMNGNKETEDLAWYEKDLSDFDFSDNEEANSEETCTRNHRRKRTSSERCTEKHQTGVVYSIDIWFLIGDHIAPEDVQRFAAICRGTHIVSHSARFWLNMYNRLTKNVQEAKALPYALSRGRMSNLHGFRSRVIRTMFLLHEPLKQRFATAQPFGTLHPDTLIGFRCTLLWHREERNLWYFFFKFHNPHRKTCNIVGSHVKVDKLDLLDDDNIHFNSEEACYVVQVVSQNFTPIPPMIMGESLTKATISVGASMRYNKIKLEFDRCVVLVDPVLNVQVYPWWHPGYPCYDKT